MNTEWIRTPQRAAKLLQQGKLVAFPTETVFGLGARADDARAIQNLFVAKGRPENNPLIVHLANVDDWSLAARTLTESARVLLREFAPGPLTVVLPKAKAICHSVTAGLDTVGLRIPSCEHARAVLRLSQVPIAAPSANFSGRPSCTTWAAVLEDLEGRIDGVFCENSSQIGLESTVVDCTGDTPVLLRTGAISLEDLQRAIPNARALEPSESSGAGQKSPGLTHPHYQPRAMVKVFEPSITSENQSLHRSLLSAFEALAADQLAICSLAGSGGAELVREISDARLVRVFPDAAEYAKGLYEFLREADRRDAKGILCELPPAVGIGIAVRDRLQRAAQR